MTGLPPGVEATGVAAGYWHSLVIGDDGKVYGTGVNESRQLTGTDDLKRTLTPLTGLPAGVRATVAAAGYAHSLVVGDDSITYGAGANDDGPLTGAEWAARTTLTPLVWGVANIVRPQVTGIPRLGRTLTAHHGHWWPAPTSIAFKWFRNGKAIPGAIHKTYHPVARDVGARLRVKVTAKHSGYQTGTQTSLYVLVHRR